LTLFKVMLPLFFGNSIYEATISLSVTFIMSQCGVLRVNQPECYNWQDSL
jgi:hypothetical protein